MVGKPLALSTRLSLLAFLKCLNGTAGEGGCLPWVWVAGSQLPLRGRPTAGRACAGGACPTPWSERKVVAAGGSWPGNVPSRWAWEGKGLWLQVGGALASGPAVSCWESLWGGAPPEGSLECSLSCTWGLGRWLWCRPLQSVGHPHSHLHSCSRPVSDQPERYIYSFITSVSAYLVPGTGPRCARLTRVNSPLFPLT